MRLVPPLKGDIVFLKVMVLNAEPQRTRSNAETIDPFLCGSLRTQRLCDEEYKLICWEQF
jgi:hypothetical protein